MNILYVRNADFDIPEANKIQVINMCKAFTQNGCETTLLAFGKDITKINKKYRIGNYFNTIFVKHKIRFFILGDILLFFHFLLKRKNTNYYIYTRNITFALLVKLFFRDKTVFYEMHDVPQRWWWRLLHIKMTSKLDCVVLISQGLKDGLINLGLNPINFIILQDAVTLSDFDIPISKEDARNQLSLPQEQIIVVYVGSTKEDRDIPALINTAKKMPAICFVVFGKEQKYIRKASNELPNFHFKGYTNRPELVYKAADILFAGYTNKVPTINYMSPLKIFEYIAAKRPIIVADFPRIREVLNENEVYFYKSENSNSIISCINEIRENKEITYAKVSKAFEKAKEYTWQNRASKVITLMKKQKL